MNKEAIWEDHRRFLAEGWIRRFTAEEPRLSEMKALYESMGLEVLLGPAIPEEDHGCSGCFDLPEFSDRYKTLYTRSTAVT